MPESIAYLQLEPGAPLVSLGFATFKAVVAVEATVTPQWQSLVSDWLVQSGCLYMMAWGQGCSSWDDSVDIANLERFNFAEIPDDQFVMTTWHSDEPLTEVFWFSKYTASHPTVELRHTLLLHISSENREREFLQSYDEA
jgi:hypothetical protein